MRSDGARATPPPAPSTAHFDATALAVGALVGQSTEREARSVARSPVVLGATRLLSSAPSGSAEVSSMERLAIGCSSL